MNFYKELKIISIDLSGRKTSEIKGLLSFCMKYKTLTMEMAVEIIRTHVDQGDGLKWYPAEEYEKEFIKFAEEFKKYKPNAFDKEFKVVENEEGEATPEYVNQDRCETAKELLSDKERTGLGGEDGGKYDDKGNSSHYQAQFMEFIREQERKYGTIVAYLACIANIDKYCQRAGVKEGVPADKDLTKRDWYTKAAKHFKIKIDAAKNGTEAEGRNYYVPLAEEVLDILKADINTDDSFPEYIPLSIAIEIKD